MRRLQLLGWVLILASFFAHGTTAWFSLGSGRWSTSNAERENDPDTNSPAVRTNDGAIRGRVIRTATGRYAQEFLNVPYAKPPVGKLRFRPPQPPDQWSDNDAVHDGTKMGNACVQNSGFVVDLLASAFMFTLFPPRVGEDCLNINVHTPFPMRQQAHDEQPQQKLPVMVWIHGGAFRVGSNTVQVFNGSVLAAEINCIVVVINYRLGPLGFFSLKGVEGVSGNQGMLDQAMALKWTKNNIEHFGGDPERITIMGVSAGSASVHYHLLSPLSRDLFANAIMQSGTALSFWSYQTPEHAQQESNWFAERANCLESDDESGSNGEDVLECLQSKSVQDIMVTTVKVLVLHQHHAMFNPTVDGVFMEKPPTEYLAAGEFARANVMLGTTKYEIALYIGWALLWGMYSRTTPSSPAVMPLLAMLYPFSIMFRAPAVLISETQFTNILEQFHDWLGNAPVEAMRFAYRNWTEPKETGVERWRMLNAIADDVFMNNAVVEMLDAYQTHGMPLYRYYFDHIPSKHLWGFPFGGSVHADDAPFFMGHVLDPRHKYDNDDVELSRRILQAVNNFMRSGNPNTASKDDGKVSAYSENYWQPYAGHLDYYTINSESYGTVHTGPERWRSEFWRRAVPYLSSLAATSRGEKLQNASFQATQLSATQLSGSHPSSTIARFSQFKIVLSNLISEAGINILWFLLPYFPLYA